MPTHPFSLGWDEQRSKAARQELLASRRYCIVRPGLETPPQAFSLGEHVLRWLEQGQAGTCFPPGTRVRMTRRKLTNIEDIRQGDQVLTAGGHAGTVQQIHTRMYDGPLIAFKLYGDKHSLRATPNHPIVTRRGKVPLEDVSEKDFVASPTKLNEEVLWLPIQRLGREDYSGPVYNLGVDEDSHTYVAEAIGVANCWVHAAVFLCELLAKANGYAAFEICRMLVGYEGKRLEGGGNPSNGGTVTDALRAMTSDQGKGIAHESLYPYSDDFGTLGKKPPQKVYDDGSKAHLALPVDVRSDDDCIQLVASKRPVGIGTWWPFNFDDKKTFMTDIGKGTYGHALTKMGYVREGVFPGEEAKHFWWQWKNWHGQLYPPLKPDYAACVPGYKPDHPDSTSDFWVRGDLDKRLQGMGNYEYVSATDLAGIGKVVDMASFEEAFF